MQTYLNPKFTVGSVTCYSQSDLFKNKTKKWEMPSHVFGAHIKSVNLRGSMESYLSSLWLEWTLAWMLFITEPVDPKPVVFHLGCALESCGTCKKWLLPGAPAGPSCWIGLLCNLGFKSSRADPSGQPRLRITGQVFLSGLRQDNLNLVLFVS